MTSSDLIKKRASISRAYTAAEFYRFFSLDSRQVGGHAQLALWIAQSPTEVTPALTIQNPNDKDADCLPLET